MNQPSNIYREQLSSKYHGIPLWRPSPSKGPDHISIGDVGYLDDGAFIRIFNATIPWDDPSNSLFGELEEYVPLNAGRFGVVQDTFGPEVYYSPHVSEVDNAHVDTHDE
jgi:hypothetical protein